MPSSLFDQHRERLEQAVAACRARRHWSPFPEVPSGRIYGETAAEEGRRAFEARLDKPFELDQPSSGERLGSERSPYGFPLGISYPAPDIPAMLRSAKGAMGAWREAGIEGRVGVCMEILQRLNRRSFELAHAVMHTTGQGFMMAFQAGGPHAQDRGLEAVALAYEAMTRIPPRVVWEKPVGKGRTARLEKLYSVVPRGLALVIGCSTFPTWNSYPGLFASLACGNPVIVKPHPRAVLPLAITVETMREVLREQGFSADLVQLAVDSAGAPITTALATRPEIRLIDYTGSGAFGDWLEAHARQAQLFTEKAGVNPVIIDSTDDFAGMTRNLAFSLCLYSGQMCTTPQNLFVPAGGIATDEGRKSFDEVAQGILGAIDGLLSEAERAAEVLGCIQNPDTLERIDRVAAAAGDAVLRASTPLAHPRFEKACLRSPLVVHAESGEEDLYMREWFGPISFLIEADSTLDAIERAARGARERGAITAAVYSTDGEVLAATAAAMLEAGVALSENLTGGIYVNQSAAFSDFHVSGANPAGNATLTDDAFVAPRFRFVQRRRPLAG